MKAGIVVPWHPEVPWEFFPRALESARAQGVPVVVEYTETGAPTALNRGWKRLRDDHGCTHFFFHSSDDTIPPGSVAKHLALAAQGKRYVYSQVAVMDEHDRIYGTWGPNPFDPASIVQVPQLVGGALFEIAMVERVPFIEGVRGMEDYLWFVDATMRGELTPEVVGVLNEPGYNHRQREGQVSRRWWGDIEYRIGVLDDVQRLRPDLWAYMTANNNRTFCGVLV